MATNPNEQLKGAAIELEKNEKEKAMEVDV